ncbi:protein toll-like [Zeugodacus cucurbitae]|uniref:protein toll-like n=1 Tax=Zeugodacus cucurbitae TaxID=28588 RepID=UPI0023D96DFD|nr:protein toll-like [Zeugodacus cucurbitae]
MPSRKPLARILLYVLLTVNEMSYSAIATRIIKQAECNFYENKTHCELYSDTGNHTLNTICEEEPKDLNSLLRQLPEMHMRNDKTQFSMTNCSRLPDVLSRPNIVYEATLDFRKPIPQSFFARSNDIQTLSLFYQDSILPTKLFVTLNEIRFLTVCRLLVDEYNAIVSVDTFVGLYNLETLVFRTNTKNLMKAHFCDLRKLKHLDLSLNAMQSIEPQLFSMLTQLSYLSLQQNELHELPPQMLSAQHNLLILDLSDNRLEHLPAGLFRHTPLLWDLRLANNLFSTPTSIIENISGLRYLYNLYLSGNKLTTLQGNDSVAHSTLFSSFSTRVGREKLLSLQANLSFISEKFPEIVYDKSLNLVKNWLSSNRFTYFDMAWLQEARLGCNFVIGLSYNVIKHINITTAIFNTTKNCGTTILLKNNPLECDCKLTWLANNNYLKNPFNLQCIVTSFENSAVTQIQRSETCDWLPALCPAGCICRLDAEALLTNCEGAALTELPHLPRPEPFSRKLSMLSLSDNNFQQLPSNATIGYANVTHLNASHNQLLTLRPTELPAKLVVLDVRHNRLEYLSAEFFSAYLKESETLQQLYLADNPWKCDCSAELLLYAVRTQRKRIADVDKMVCDNRPSVRLLNANFEDFCSRKLVNSTEIFTIAAIIIGMLLIIVLYYKYQLPVHVWLYSHDLLGCYVKEYELDKEKTFDAFISYAHQDANYVNQTLLPQLEQGEPPFRICTHERNWLAGAYIPEQIDESIAQSCRTIIILSQHFIESNWARMEFRTAHQCALNEGRARIIIIKYGEITVPERVDKELQAYLDMNTYLEWSDTRFWQKLRYAMPHKRDEVRKAGMLEVSRRVYVTGQEELSCE